MRRYTALHCSTLHCTTSVGHYITLELHYIRGTLHQRYTTSEIHHIRDALHPWYTASPDEAEGSPARHGARGLLSPEARAAAVSSVWWSLARLAAGDSSRGSGRRCRRRARCSRKPGMHSFRLRDGFQPSRVRLSWLCALDWPSMSCSVGL